MASIQEIVARRAPVASLPQASPNPNVGVGLISDAGSAGFRQVGQVRGISLDTATGFGQAMATDAQTVGMVGQAVGQIATAVDELNEANEKARLVSAGKLASKKIEEWNSISDETQREEFRVKQVEPALARINSQRKGLINIANDTRNALVSEMGILSNAHMANTAKSNGYMELAKLRIELDNAKDLGEGDVLAERYLSLSTSLITSGTLDPKEAYLLGKDTQAILKTSKENRLTAEYQGLIQNVPDDEINNVIEKLQKEGKGYVFSEDSEFRVLEKALDKSPVFRAKLLEDERARRLKELKAIVQEGEALESLAFQEERGQLEDVKSSIRAKINAYEGGDVGGYTQELLNEYKGFSSKFRAKLRIDADKAINIRTTLRNANLKEFIPKGQNILFALDKSGNANIFQSYSEAQDKRKFLDDYLNSEESASFRDLLTEHGISLESAESAFLRIYNDPISQTSVRGFNTPRETITKNFLSKAKNIVENNLILKSMGRVDPKLIPNIMGGIQEEVTRLREANPNIADLKGALADLQKRFETNPRSVLELSSKESIVREKLSGEPISQEDIEKQYASLPNEKVELINDKMRGKINLNIISDPKHAKKVATGEDHKLSDLFSPFGMSILKNPNISRKEKKEMLREGIIIAKKIHEFEQEKKEALPKLTSDKGGKDLGERLELDEIVVTPKEDISLARNASEELQGDMVNKVGKKVASFLKVPENWVIDNIVQPVANYVQGAVQGEISTSIPDPQLYDSKRSVGSGQLPLKAEKRQAIDRTTVSQDNRVIPDIATRQNIDLERNEPSALIDSGAGKVDISKLPKARTEQKDISFKQMKPEAIAQSKDQLKKITSSIQVPAEISEKDKEKFFANDSYIEVATKSTVKGIGNDYFKKLGEVESSWRPLVRNKGAGSGTATGPYQFINDTWLEMLPELKQKIKSKPNRELGEMTREDALALRTDAEWNAKAINRFTEKNKTILKKAGISINYGSLYLAHMLGVNGAKQVLKNPSKKLKDTLKGFKRVKKHNPKTVTDKTTGKDLLEWANKRMSDKKGNK